MQIQSLIVELDAYVIVNMLCAHNSCSGSLSPLLDDCRNLLSRTPHHRIQHCFREVIWCADAPARMGADMGVDFISFDAPPACILDQIMLDAVGTFTVGAALAAPFSFSFFIIFPVYPKK